MCFSHETHEVKAQIKAGCVRYIKLIVLNIKAAHKGEQFIS